MRLVISRLLLTFDEFFILKNRNFFSLKGTVIDIPQLENLLIIITVSFFVHYSYYNYWSFFHSLLSAELSSIWNELVWTQRYRKAKRSVFLGLYVSLFLNSYLCSCLSDSLSLFPYISLFLSVSLFLSSSEKYCELSDWFCHPTRTFQSSYQKLLKFIICPHGKPTPKRYGTILESG